MRKISLVVNFLVIWALLFDKAVEPEFLEGSVFESLLLTRRLAPYTCMKMKSVARCFFLVPFLSTAAMAQVTVYSEVGGFDTIPIEGTGGGGSRLTFAATQFLQSAKYSGIATLIGTETLYDASATWLENAFNGVNGSHYVEIMSVNGSATVAGVGITRTIVGTQAASKTITLIAPLPEGLMGPIEYRIISHWTLAAIFGASNSAGLQGGTSLTADLVQLWNGVGYDSYYYQSTGLGGIGWRRVGDQSTNAGSTIIRPDQSMIIKRVGASTLPLVVNGWVKTGQASVEIVNGFNFIPNPFTEQMTLGSCGLFTDNAETGLAAGDATTADQVMIWNGTIYETYYYQNAGLGGVGWRRVGAQTTDASATAIKAGTSVILRRNRATGFVWAIPQPLIGL